MRERLAWFCIRCMLDTCIEGNSRTHYLHTREGRLLQPNRAARMEYMQRAANLAREVNREQVAATEAVAAVAATEAVSAVEVMVALVEASTVVEALTAVMGSEAHAAVRGVVMECSRGPAVHRARFLSAVSHAPARVQAVAGGP